MNKLCIFLGIMIFSTLGGILGSYVSFMTSFLLSGVGSILGVYIGWRINRDYLQ